MLAIGSLRLTRSTVLRRTSLRGVVLLVALVTLAGCRTFSNRAPVSQSTATCRQLTQQGISAIEREDWKRAETVLARAVQTSGNDADARRNYAEALWHRGALADALEQLEKARELAGEDPGLIVRNGELCLAMSKLDRASELAGQALTVDSRFSPAWTLRGRVAVATGKPRDALAHYQRALAYAPGDLEVPILVAETYRQLNEPDRALLALQSVADNYSAGEVPQHVLYLEGLALTALARYDDAVSALSQAARRDRPNADILCALADAELFIGRTSNAQYTLEQALALDPNHAGSRALAARLASAPPPAAPTTSPATIRR